MRAMKRVVGILGGMGPEATVLLMQRVLAATPAQDDADHIPLLVDQNPQVPSRIRHLIEGTGDDPGPVLAAMARRLEAAGAEVLAMPCNTAHHYLREIRAAVTIPMIDMVSLSVAKAAALAGPGGSVGILASPAVRRVGLFDHAFASAGIVPIYPENEEAMLATIRRIKSQGAVPEATAGLAAASSALLARGARTQMIACTEFSLISDAVDRGAIAFDTLDQLVGGIIAFANSHGNDKDKAGEQPPFKSTNASSTHPNKETTL
jgi:aspartate racemase